MSQAVKQKMFAYQKLVDIFVQQKIDVLFQTACKHPLLIQDDRFFITQLIHDQATIHAADGYSRATGKVGVGWISSESGVTNAVTSIGTAQLDSVPLVIFIEHQSEVLDQQVDVDGLTKSMTKFNFTPQTAGELIFATEKAFEIAHHGRPGIVIIDFNRKLLKQSYRKIEPMQVDLLEKKTIIKPVPSYMIDKLSSIIKRAKRPVVLVGGGCILANAQDSLGEFFKKTNIPFVSTLMGLGAVSESHPLHLGMLGMHGTLAANRAVYQTDLLICLGVRFSDRITGNIVGFSPDSIKVQVDIDPAEINKLINVDHPIIGDVDEVISELNQLDLAKTDPTWVETVLSRQKKSARFHNSKGKLIDPGAIIRLLKEHANDDVVVSTDVGQHQMWTAHHFSFDNPNQLLTSGGFGTMGYGLPAAVGAALRKPSQQVICVTGDGSFQMNLQELMTAIRYNLNIKVVILRNGYLGMVRQWQELFYERNYSQVQISSPNFIKLAASYGIKGLQAKNIVEAEAIIKEAMAIDGPVVMDFTIENEANVYPIVPPGENNKDALEK